MGAKQAEKGTPPQAVIFQTIFKYTAQEALRLGEYQGEEAMQGVNTIVDKAQNNTNQLLGVQNLSEQTLETWTKGITNIYNDAAKEYGLTIDMVGVVQAAQANAANDTGGVLNAVQMAEYRAMFGLTQSIQLFN